MSTTIRPELSKNNKYWLPKERYLELKHFCLQYPQWKKDLASINYYISNANFDKVKVSSGWISGPEYIAEKLIDMTEKIAMVDTCVLAADPAIIDYLFVSVTTGKSYVYLKTKMNIPCGKDYFYERYHKFFWELDKIREGGIHGENRTGNPDGSNKGRSGRPDGVYEKKVS